MTRNTKTERTHDVLKQYLDPRLRSGVSINWRPFLIGCNDHNIVQRIDDIVGAVCRATAGDLAMDASAPELTRKLKEAVVEPDGTTTKEAPPFDQSIVDRILALLEMKLLPTELAAVRQILTEPPRRKTTVNMTAEDTKLALDYAQRWPDAAKIRVEPAMTPAPQRQSPTANPAAYFERFPSARRIGQA